MNKIRKGDEVVVRTGRDKNRRGHVIAVRADQRILVGGLNMVKKHVKPNPNQGIAGGVIEQEAAIHISNIMLFNPKTQKGDRVGVRVLSEKGKNGKQRKVRFFKSNNELVD